MKTLSRQSGFTLVEIIVVVALVGLLAAMVFLTFGQATREAALDSSYASVITALESARGKAMQGVGDGSGGQSVTISSDEVVNANGTTVPLSPNVTISNTGTIEFKRISGEATDGANDLTTPEVFIISDSNGNSRTATVTPDGYIYHE